MDSDDTDDLQFPSPDPLPNSIRIALWELANEVHSECGTKGGVTALYWHLLGTCIGHLKREGEGDQT